MIAAASSSNISRILVWTVIAICGLNLNGVLYMLFGIDQAFSAILLVASLYLFIKHGKLLLTNEVFLTYILALMAYVFFAAFFSIFSDDNPLKFIFTYVSSGIVIVAVASYFSSAQMKDYLEKDLLFLKTVLLVASGSVWFSRVLFSHYANPPAATDRFSGFFGNPNEAGIISVIAFALVLVKPSRFRWLQFFQIVCSSGAIFFTFSKSSIIVLILVFLLYSILQRKIGLLFFLLLFSFTLLTVSEKLLLQHLTDLTLSQQTRIEQLIQIATRGEISSETTTGRTYVWDLALTKLAAAFPFASGFGSFHYLVGGIKEAGVWQGCHNTYLMVLGEAGFIAFVALVVANLKLLFASFAYRSNRFVFLYVTILQWDMLSAHNILGLRFHNMLTGLCIGLIVRERTGGSPRAFTSTVNHIRVSKQPPEGFHA